MKKWYGVRTLFLSSVITKKKKIEKSYSQSSVMLEERVILYFVRDIEAAIRLAEKEAKDYARYDYINIYGDKVKCRYLKIYDTFELCDAPADRVEVFSASDVYLDKKSANLSARNRLGPNHSMNKEKLLRKKFQHM